jgi:FMN phosphatase YigB (HAD superfamily)
MPDLQSKQEVFIFDIDGTLADHKGIRGPFEEHKIHLDKPIDPVWKVLNSLVKHYKIVFVSGRTDGCYSTTVQWLDQYLHSTDLELYMRKAGDMRKDSIVKKEIYDEHIFPKYNVIGVFDDRLQVCRMLYENNIFCFNVNQGLKEF